MLPSRRSIALISARLPTLPKMLFHDVPSHNYFFGGKPLRDDAI